jgi:hypothetical protein
VKLTGAPADEPLTVVVGPVVLGSAAVLGGTVVVTSAVVVLVAGDAEELLHPMSSADNARALTPTVREVIRSSFARPDATSADEVPAVGPSRYADTLA